MFLNSVNRQTGRQAGRQADRYVVTVSETDIKTEKMPTVLHRARLLRLQFLFPSSALSVSEPPWIPDQIVSLVRSRLFASENPLQVCVCVCLCVHASVCVCCPRHIWTPITLGMWENSSGFYLLTDGWGGRCRLLRRPPFSLPGCY